MSVSPAASRSHPLPPGNFGPPLIGETIQFFRDRDFANKRHQQFGPIFKTRLFGRPTIFIAGAEANRFFLTNENKYVTSTWPTSTRKLLGPASLAVQTGSFHQQRRKLLAQAFQPRALDSYIPAMVRITQQYLGTWANQSELTWYPELRRYTFDIASHLFVGSEAGSETALGEAFETWCNGLFTLPIPLPWTKFGQALEARKHLLDGIEKIVRQRQQQAHSGDDALGILLQAEDENGERLSLAELKDQILLLLFAGHETLTSAIASCCLLLAQHPEVLARVRQEQAQFDDATAFTAEGLKQMTYLDQVLKEVLRLVPPVGGGFRQLIQTCQFGGYTFPDRWTILYQINRTHQDPALYPDCDRFDPDRFDPANSADKQAVFGYVPFGGGMRECLGKEFARLEMRIFAAMLARDYQWQLLPDQDLTLVQVPTPHPRDGLKVRFVSATKS